MSGTREAGRCEKHGYAWSANGRGCPRCYDDYNPDWVMHPGWLVQEILDDNGMKQSVFARETGWSAKHINMVIKGHVPISIGFALLIEECFGVNARLLLNMQLAYDLGLARGLKDLT